MTAYYNEIDPGAAAWLRELIKQGHIAPGVIDERDIRDVHAEELREFTQCHFFAGIGIWSYSLRLAGWPDDRPVWTGSCPCQPFSQTGRKGGFTDERHLWPAWYHLVRKCRPRAIFGEQVASADGLEWFELVQSDLEAAGYAVGAVDLCAAGIGAPHIRQRLWFIARNGVAQGDSVGSGLQGLPGYAQGQRQGSLFSSEPRALADGTSDGGQRVPAMRENGGDEPDALRSLPPGELALPDREPCRQGGSDARGGREGGSEGEGPGSRGDDLPRQLADSGSDRTREYPRELSGDEEEHEERRANRDNAPEHRGPALLVADAPGEQRREGREPSAGREPGSELGLTRRRADVFPRRTERPGPVNGFWRASDWLLCRDGKWRPVEPGTFPLAHGAPGRVGLLRGYGNGIVAEAAAEVIGTVLDIEDELDKKLR